jgi:hypothetical protein
MEILKPSLVPCSEQKIIDWQVLLHKLHIHSPLLRRLFHRRLGHSAVQGQREGPGHTQQLRHWGCLRQGPHHLRLGPYQRAKM